MHCRVIRLNTVDEAQIAACFAKLCEEFPEVAAGSYPSHSGVSISLEAKDAEQVAAAVARFRDLLDADADPGLSAEQCIKSMHANVDSLTASTQLDH